MAGASGRGESSFRGAWFRTVTLAECVGFGIPAVAWFAAWRAGLPSVPLYVVVVLAGMGEGAVLGFGQARVLRRALPGIEKAWIARTALAAGLAWAAGLLPNTLDDAGAPVWLIVALMVTMAPLLLLSLGLAQWTVLQGRIAKAWRWVPWSVAAWLAALPPTFIAPALVPDGSPAWAWGVAFVFGGVSMAAIMAAVTGEGMTRLLRSQPDFGF